MIPLARLVCRCLSLFQHPSNITRVSSQSASALLLLLVVLLLNGCFGGGGGGGDKANTVSIRATAIGYYSPDVAHVFQDDDTTALDITDLQAIAYGNHIRMFSDANVLQYDILLKSINSDNYLGDLSVYRDGELLMTTSVNGTITAGSSISGNMMGTGSGHGTFNLIYSMINNVDASTSTIDTSTFVDLTAITGVASGLQFSVNPDGTLVSVDNVGTLNIFNQCAILDNSGQFSPISGSSLFNITVDLTACADPTVSATYTGNAALQTNNVLVVVMTNGDYTLYSEFFGNP